LDNHSFSSLVDDLDKINNLTSLKSLILSNNPLMSIPALSLTNLVNLQLENTYLKSITFPKSYENCTRLQSVVLSNNTLTKINSDSFKSLSSLTKIFLDNTGLNSIEQDAFISMSNTLQSISLVSNSLKSAEFLPTMNNLLSVNFDKNHFKQLPTEMIKPGRTKYFAFRDNQIDIIDELSPLFYWTKTNLSDVEVYLNNNPFDCCQSRWFIHYLTGPTNLVKDSFNLTCALPRSYTGKRLIELRADLMDCSYNPSDVRFSKVGIVLSCLGGVVMLVLVVIGLTLCRRNRTYFGRRQAYEPIEGDILPA
jgi:hypothetical protein